MVYFSFFWPQTVQLMTTTYSVQFVGHVIQDEFTEYHMKVTSSDNTSWLVRRRYREFRERHDHLKLKYPDRIPSMPGKKLWGNQDPEFVRQRQDQLQMYMDGVLGLEPDCRTRVLQRFLEIKKLSGGSPVIEHSASPPRHPVPTTHIPSSSSSSSVPARDDKSKQQKISSAAELQAVVTNLESKIFDLSVQPTLLDEGEYQVRRKKYEQIVSRATVASVPTCQAGPVANDSVWAKAAWDVARGQNREGSEALSAIIGSAPIATEKDLVAFFTS